MLLAVHVGEGERELLGVTDAEMVVEAEKLPVLLLLLAVAEALRVGDAVPEAVMLPVALLLREGVSLLLLLSVALADRVGAEEALGLHLAVAELQVEAEEEPKPEAWGLRV